jgi:transposase
MSRDLFVGIDVSNATLAVEYLDSDERTVRPWLEYTNDPQGWLALKTDIISAAALLGKRTKIICGMESTGNMHKQLENALRKEKRRKLEVHVLNPKAVKHFWKALLKKAKTDKVDSHVIAQFLIRMKLREQMDPPEGIEELKEITRTRRRLIEERTSAKNRLHKMLRYHFPGYQTLLGKTLTNRILLVVSTMPSPSDILAHSLDELAAMTNGTRHRFGEDFSSNLLKLANQAPEKKLRKSTMLLFTTTADRILDLNRQISTMDAVIEELLDDVFPEQNLTSIPGVGKTSAASILAETGHVARFETKSSFVGYCGLFPVIWESGEAKRKYRMTRSGNRMLKMTLLIASAAARQYNPVIAAHYNRLRSKGKSTKSCGGAIARKLAEIVYAILYSRESWSPDKATLGLEKATRMAQAEGNK